MDDASSLAAGDEVLVLSQQGSDAGTHELVFVSAVTSNTLTLEPALAFDYDGSSVVLVQRVPHATDFTLSSGSTLDASGWAGSGGGVLLLRATGDVDISGTIDLTGLGFRGGDGVAGNGSDPDQGESHGGLGASGDTSANDGGGGSPDTESDGSSSSNVAGDGGAGGGLVAIWAGTSLDVSGSSVSAQGGAGGASAWHSGVPYGSAYGGDGGEGRIRLEYDSLDGTSYPSGDETVTEPDAGSSAAWED